MIFERRTSYKSTLTWEQRKLGNLAEIRRGSSPRPIKSTKWFDEKSPIGWLRIADVSAQNGRITHLDQHISDAGQSKTRVLMNEHLLLSIAATVGKPVINYIPTGVHDGFLIFYKPQFNLEFLFQWLEHIRYSWAKYGQPGSQLNLNAELVRNKEISLPIEKEQNDIGNLLSLVEKNIAANECKQKIVSQISRRFFKLLFSKRLSLILDSPDVS